MVNHMRSLPAARRILSAAFAFFSAERFFSALYFYFFIFMNRRCPASVC